MKAFTEISSETLTKRQPNRCQNLGQGLYVYTGESSPKPQPKTFTKTSTKTSGTST